MTPEPTSMPSFVIKAEELVCLNFLDRSHPRPRKIEWINRGTNQVLRPTSVQMLLRTLFRETNTPSVSRLHHSSGMRALFGTSAEREAFAKAFAAARSKEQTIKQSLAIAVFDDREAAERAIAALKDEGIPDQAISVMWTASRYLDAEYRWTEGHSALSVAGAVAGGSAAGVMLGAGAFFIPGVAPVAGGILAASALSSVASVSGIIGGVGGAIARMLTDHDVDGVAARHFEEEVRRGKVFISVDMRVAPDRREAVFKVLGSFRVAPAIALDSVG